MMETSEADLHSGNADESNGDTSAQHARFEELLHDSLTSETKMLCSLESISKGTGDELGSNAQPFDVPVKSATQRK